MRFSNPLLALLFATSFANLDPGIASSPLRSNRYPLRDRRASGDVFNVSLDHLKAVARVANGIFLTRKFIDGIDKTETDAIIAEVLLMGEVTPDQVVNYPAVEVNNTIDKMKSVQEKLKGGDKVKDVETNWKKMTDISKDLKGINNFISWTDHGDYKSAVNALKNKDVDVTVASNLRSNINSLLSNYGALKSDPSKLASTGGFAGGVIDLISKLNSTGYQFSDKGSAVKLSSLPVKVVRNAKIAQSLRAPFPDGLNGGTTNLMSLFAIGQTDGQLTASFDVLAHLIGTRIKFGAARKLQYTPGLPNGFTDLSNLQIDVENGWMVNIINSSRFSEAVSGLKMLETSLSGFDAKISPHVANFDSIKTLRNELDMMATFPAGIAALTSLKSCQTNIINVAATSVETIDTASQEIDKGFQIIQNAINSAIAMIRDKDVVKKLGDFKAICDRQSGSNEADLVQQLTPFQTTLIPSLNQIASTLSSIDSQVSPIKTKAADAADVVDNVSDELKVINGMKGLYDCLRIDNLDLVGSALELVDSLRGRQGNMKRFTDELAVVAAVANSSANLPVLITAISGLKGQETEESKALTLLADPKKTSETIGKAVQAVVLMDQVFKKRSDIYTVLANLGQILPAVPAEFDQNDIALLTNLSNLESAFSALNTSINTWHNAVKDKTVTTLEDAKNIFTPSSSVTGVSEDLGPMIAALERLVGANSGNYQLKSLNSSLSELGLLDLNFAAYSTPLAAAVDEMVVLKNFFVSFDLSFTQSVGQDSNEARNKSDSGNGGALGYSYAEDDEEFDEVIIYEVSIVVHVIWIGCVVIMVCLAVYLVLLFIWYNRKVKQLEGDIKKLDEELLKIDNELSDGNGKQSGGGTPPPSSSSASASTGTEKSAAKKRKFGKKKIQ